MSYWTVKKISRLLVFKSDHFHMHETFFTMEQTNQRTTRRFILSASGAWVPNPAAQPLNPPPVAPSPPGPASIHPDLIAGTREAREMQEYMACFHPMAGVDLGPAFRMPDETSTAGSTMASEGAATSAVSAQQTPSSLDLRECSFCKHPGARKKCPDCLTRYCDKQCQLDHWRVHKFLCPGYCGGGMAKSGPVAGSDK